MVNFLTLVGLLRRLPKGTVNNYIRQNRTPTIESLLEYSERSAVVAHENSGNESEDDRIEELPNEKKINRVKIDKQEPKRGITRRKCYTCQKYGHEASQCSET